MHRARRALSRRWALWTVALTLGGVLAVAEKLVAREHPASPPAASGFHAP